MRTGQGGGGPHGCLSSGFLGDTRCWIRRCFSTLKSWGKELKTQTKQLCDPDNHDAVVSHSEPDVLECEVKWALGSTAANKASAGVGIPAELFKILKDYAIKVPHSLCQQIWKTQQWPQDWKRLILIPNSKKGSTKECSNHWTIALISHARKVMLKTLQARLKHYVNQELLMFNLGLEKAEEPEIHLLSFYVSQRKQENSRKISTSVSSILLKP